MIAHQLTSQLLLRPIILRSIRAWLAKSPIRKFSHVGFNKTVDKKCLYLRGITAGRFMSDTGLNRSKTWYPFTALNIPSPSSRLLFLIISSEGSISSSNSKPARCCFDQVTVPQNGSRFLIVIKTFSPWSSLVCNSMPAPLSVTFRNIASTWRMRSFDSWSLISRLGRTLVDRLPVSLGVSSMIMILPSPIWT